MYRDAEISPDGRMRYWLMRVWSDGCKPIIFVLLNPSTADANIDDATVRKCCAFGKRLGYDGMFILNLFSFRATDPRELKRADYPNDAINDATIKSLVKDAGVVVCGWGANARGLLRAAEVLQMIRDGGATPYALRLLRDGIPEHPLYLPLDSQLIAR